MFVVTFHNQVILGPIQWDASYIASVVQEDLDLNYKPVLYPSDILKVPFDLVEYVRVRHAEEVKPFHNSKIEKLVGPTWTFNETKGTATYTVEYKSVEEVKLYIKNELARQRWFKENSGFEYQLANSTIFVDTSREKRNLYSEKLLISQDRNVQWKNNDVWVELTNSDLVDIVNQIHNHVQDAFDWEVAKLQECSSIESFELLKEFIENNGL